MKKRSLLAALLAGVMALGLCACGGSSEPAASGGEDGEDHKRIRQPEEQADDDHQGAEGGLLQ